MSRDDTAGLAEFRSYLRTGEFRAAGEQTVAGGGAMVPPAFSSEVIRLLKEYSALIGDMEWYSTPNGAPMTRPSVQASASFAPAPGYGTENTVLTTGPDAVFGAAQYSAQSFGEAYTIAALLQVSNQLVADSGVDLDQLIAENGAEVIGRQLAIQAATGSGTSAPQGLIPALNTQGTAGTVSTTSASAITATGGFVQLATAYAPATISSTTGTELGTNVLGLQTLTSMIQGV